MDTKGDSFNFGSFTLGAIAYLENYYKKVTHWGSTFLFEKNLTKLFEIWCNNFALK